MQQDTLKVFSVVQVWLNEEDAGLRKSQSIMIIIVVRGAYLFLSLSLARWHFSTWNKRTVSLTTMTTCHFEISNLPLMRGRQTYTLEKKYRCACAFTFIMYVVRWMYSVLFIYSFKKCILSRARTRVSWYTTLPVLTSSSL